MLSSNSPSHPCPHWLGNCPPTAWAAPEFLLHRRRKGAQTRSCHTLVYMPRLTHSLSYPFKSHPPRVKIPKKPGSLRRSNASLILTVDPFPINQANEQFGKASALGTESSDYLLGAQKLRTSVGPGRKAPTLHQVLYLLHHQCFYFIG